MHDHDHDHHDHHHDDEAVGLTQRTRRRQGERRVVLRPVAVVAAVAVTVVCVHVAFSERLFATHLPVGTHRTPTNGIQHTQGRTNPPQAPPGEGNGEGEGQGEGQEGGDVCACATRVHEGVWMDNIWTWQRDAQAQCGYHHMSHDEARGVMQGECVLVLGDSQSRRFAQTLGKVLQLETGVTPQEANTDIVRFHGFLEIGERYGLGQHGIACLDYQWAPFPQAVIDKLANLTKPYTTFVVSIAVHDVNDRMRNPNTPKELEAMARALCDMQTSAKIVFRTTPYSAWDDLNVFFDRFNALVRDILFSNSAVSCCGNHSLVLLEHSHVMRDRSTGALRPPHDDNNPHHMGTVARMTLAQTYLNQWRFVRDAGLSECCGAPAVVAQTAKAELEGDGSAQAQPRPQQQQAQTQPRQQQQQAQTQPRQQQQQQQQPRPQQHPPTPPAPIAPGEPRTGACDYSGPHPSTFLRGCVDGCSRYHTKDAAMKRCDAVAKCSGFTMMRDGSIELRSDGALAESTSGEQSFVKGSCDTTATWEDAHPTETFAKRCASAPAPAVGPPALAADGHVAISLKVVLPLERPLVRAWVLAESPSARIPARTRLVASVATGECFALEYEVVFVPIAAATQHLLHARLEYVSLAHALTDPLDGESLSAAPFVGEPIAGTPFVVDVGGSQGTSATQSTECESSDSASDGFWVQRSTGQGDSVPNAHCEAIVPSAKLSDSLFAAKCPGYTLDHVPPYHDARSCTTHRRSEPIALALANRMFHECTDRCVFSLHAEPQRAWMWDEDQGCWAESDACFADRPVEVDFAAQREKSFCREGVATGTPENPLTCGPPHLSLTGWEWQPRRCNLPILSKDEAAECLGRVDVTVAGDSVPLNLVDYLTCALGHEAVHTVPIQQTMPGSTAAIRGFFQLREKSGVKGGVLVLNPGGLWQTAYGSLGLWNSSLPEVLRLMDASSFDHVFLLSTSAVHPVHLLGDGGRTSDDIATRKKWFMTGPRAEALNTMAARHALGLGRVRVIHSWPLYDLREDDPLDRTDMRHYGPNTRYHALQLVLAHVCGPL